MNESSNQAIPQAQIDLRARVRIPDSVFSFGVVQTVLLLAMKEAAGSRQDKSGAANKLGTWDDPSFGATSTKD
jgi:hypothetical protein